MCYTSYIDIAPGVGGGGWGVWGGVGVGGGVCVCVCVCVGGGGGGGGVLNYMQRSQFIWRYYNSLADNLT